MKRRINESKWARKWQSTCKENRKAFNSTKPNWPELSGNYGKGTMRVRKQKICEQPACIIRTTHSSQSNFADIRKKVWACEQMSICLTHLGHIEHPIVWIMPNFNSLTLFVHTQQHGRFCFGQLQPRNQWVYLKKIKSGTEITHENFP